MNIINFENVDKPDGGGGRGADNVDKVFCYILALVNTFLVIFIHI